MSQETVEWCGYTFDVDDPNDDSREWLDVRSLPSYDGVPESTGTESLTLQNGRPPSRGLRE